MHRNNAPRAPMPPWSICHLPITYNARTRAHGGARTRGPALQELGSRNNWISARAGPGLVLLAAQLRFRSEAR